MRTCSVYSLESATGSNPRQQTQQKNENPQTSDNKLVFLGFPFYKWCYALVMKRLVLEGSSLFYQLEILNARRTFDTAQGRVTVAKFVVCAGYLPSNQPVHVR